MAAYDGYSIPARSNALSFASSLAQGVEAGLQTYQQRQAQKAELAIKQQQVQSEAALRNMQMQKIQQEMAPLTFDAAKLHLLMQAGDSGYEPPPSLIKDQWQKVMDHVDSPDKLQVANQFLSAKQKALTTQMTPDQFSEMYGSDAKLAPAQPVSGPSSTTTQGDSPAPAQSQSSGSAPTRSASFGDLEMSAPKQPTTFSMSPQEAKMYEGFAKTAKDAEIGRMAFQGKTDATYAGMLNNLNTQAGALARTKDQDEAKKGIAALQAQLKDMLGHLEAKTKEDVATINAKGKVDAAKVRGSGKGPGKNSDLGLLDNMIKDNSKAIDGANKPPSGFSMEMPSDAAARKQALGERGQKLIAARGLVAKGKSMDVAMQMVGLAPPAAAPSAAPSAPAAPAAKTKAPPAAPAFSRSQGQAAVDAMKKLPEGAVFTLDNEKYQIKSGQPVPAQ